MPHTNHSAKKSKGEHKAVTRVREQHLREPHLHVCTLFKVAKIVAIGFRHQANVEEASKTAREELMRAKQHAPSSNVKKKHNDTLSAGLSKLSLYNDTDKNLKQDLNLTLPQI